MFDLEGTLLTSNIDFGEMRKKINDVLVSHGFRDSSFSFMLITNIKRFTATLRERGVSDAEITMINKEIADAIHEVEMEHIEETIEIPGSRRILEELKVREIQIGIVTRNNRASAVEALRITGLLKFIDVLVALDDCDNPKPNPEHLLKALMILNIKPSETIMIGNGKYDALCAINARVKFIGVLTGHRQDTMEEFMGMGVEFLPSIEDLIDLLDKPLMN